MPSPPSPRGRERASSLRVLAALACLLAGCAGAAPPAPRAAPPPADHAYLLPAHADFPLLLDSATAERLAEGHALLAAGDAAAARALAAELLALQPGLQAAEVLVAQADLASRDWEAAVGRLAPVVQELPDYVAARLALGRAAEHLGEVTTAYDAYRGAAATSPLAARRAAELRPRALEVARQRVEDALRRGRVEEAQGHLAQLEDWAPGEEATLAAAAAVARAAGDARAELAALRRLRDGRPGERIDRADRAQIERLAALELEVGDPARGVEVYEELARRHPADLELQARLAAAKFRWRLALLPAEVRDLGERPVLTRADFALLLYWAVPEVRYGRSAGARIAADVLDHPQREAIVRVVNLGLLDVHPSLHRFAPDAELARVDALVALLRLLAGHGGRVACVATAGVPPAREAACALAAGCRLIADPGDCLPQAPLSGAEALTLLERTLDLLPGR